MINSENNDRITALERRGNDVEAENIVLRRFIDLILAHLKLKIKVVRAPYELVPVEETHARDF